MPLKFGTKTFQLVLFLTALDLKDKLKLAQELRAIEAVDLNGEPTLLPIPDDAPVEIPRIILRSEDKSYQMNVSFNRVDLVYVDNESEGEEVPVTQMEEIKDRMVKALEQIYDVLVKNYSANVNRSAVVTRQIVKLETDSKTFLESKLLKESPTKPFEIRLAYLYKESLGEKSFEINKWQRVETLRKKDNTEDDSALAVTYDVNTINEVDYDFSGENLSKFFNLAIDLITNEVKEFAT